MNLITLTPPTIEPVTLEQCYAHLRLTPDDSPRTHPDDAMLLRQIKTARQDVENRTRRALVKQKLRAILGQSDDCWPWPTIYRSWWGGQPRGLDLPKPPLLSVVEVSYYDASGALVIVDPADYFASEDDPAKLYFGTGFVAPDVYPRADAMRVDFWAGYQPEGSPEDDFVTNVPEPLKAAILLGVEMQYEALDPRQREMLENAQDALLVPYTSFVGV
jgi:uncharacterized phiE125 gp8 family phage protein